MNCLDKVVTWYTERKFTKDRNLLFDNALKLHEENFLERFENGREFHSMDVHAFHKEHTLSINFGRRFGTTSYIKYRMSRDPNTILFYEKQSYIEKEFTKDTLRRYQKVLRAFCITSNTKGLTIPNKDQLKTIIVDRASFHKSNEKIIADIFLHYGMLLNLKFRIVILG
jgi:hypothetical protein